MTDRELAEAPAEQAPAHPPKHARVARLIAALAALTALVATGMLVAPYLVHAGFCAPGAGCDVVAKSKWGTIFGVPVAFIGAIAYSVGLASVIAPGRLAKRLAPVVGGAALAAALGFLFLQKYVIGAWCVFCVIVDVSSIVFGGALFWEWWGARAHAAPRHPLFPAPLALAGVLAISLPVMAATRRTPEPPVATLEKSVGRDPQGRLILREFVDLECPYCRALHQLMREKLKARPDIVLERRHVPLPRHPHALDAAKGACCAAEQGAEDRFVDAVVDQDIEPSAKFCRGVAEDLKLDLGKYDACVASDRPTKRIEADKALLESTGFRGLPTMDLEGERSLGLLDDAHADAFLARHK
jgi:protein-disulfide isomerase/uncharacterized membrane protein